MVRLGNRTARLAVASMLLSVAMAALTPRVAAGQHQLDATISQQVNISGAAEAEVKRWAAENTQGLTSDDPVVVQRSKQALARPLRDASTTVGFRVKATQLLEGQLREVAAAAEDARVAVNAAIVAADLASDNGLNLLRHFRDDTRPAVRYRAIKGFGTSMLLAQQAEPAFGDQAAMNVVRELGAGLADETDPDLLVAYVTSLEHASKVDRFAGMRDLALEQLATATSARLNNLDGQPADVRELDPLVRGLIHIRSQMIRVGNPVGAEATRAGVEAAGQLVAWAYRYVRANGLPDSQNPEQVDLYRILLTGLNLAQNIFTLVDPEKGEEIQQLRLLDAARSGDAQGFLRGAGRLIGEGGILSQPPYSVPAGTFRLGERDGGG